MALAGRFGERAGRWRGAAWALTGRWLGVRGAAKGDP